MSDRKYLWRRTALALTILMALVLPAVSPVPAAAPGPEPVSAAEPVAVAAPVDLYGVRVNGVPMDRDPMLTQHDGVLYAALRSVSQALLPDAQISWTGTHATVTRSGVLALTAAPGASYITANGRCLHVPQTVLARNGSVLVPLDTLMTALGAACVTQPDGTLDLTSGSQCILPADKFYDPDDLYWLSHIIYAESGNQPLNGKIAVGNVVLNRRDDPLFPNTVKGVIFQKNQFSPVASGTIYKTPNAESEVAAKLCLEGAVILDNVLYFNRTGLRSWASRNRPYVATIAQHAFYR